MKIRPYLLHALSPLHAGTGQSNDVIDLPIARMRATGIPIAPGSSVKGVLREARKPPTLTDEEWTAIFGPRDNPSVHAGALIVSDARLLALPVRSFRGTFAWVSSPLLLELAWRDCQGCGLRDLPAPLPAFSKRHAVVSAVAGENGSLNVHADGKGHDKVYLEDLDLPVAPMSDRNEEGQALAAAAGAWASFLAPRVAPAGSALLFARRFVAVDDEVMSFLCETATQVDARVRLREDTRTVARGALWSEESLPPESVLIGLLLADPSRKPKFNLDPGQVILKALPEEAVLQFGGKASVGRGRCRMVPVTSEAK